MIIFKSLPSIHNFGYDSVRDIIFYHTTDSSEMFNKIGDNKRFPVRDLSSLSKQTPTKLIWHLDSCMHTL